MKWDGVYEVSGQWLRFEDRVRSVAVVVGSCQLPCRGQRERARKMTAFLDPLEVLYKDAANAKVETKEKKKGRRTALVAA